MNYTRFERRHRTAIKNIMESLRGLRNHTTIRQKKNGTIAIYDIETEVTYTLHRSGYIRHNDDKGYGSSWWHGGTKRSWQLNRVETGRFQRTERILATADEQIVILMNAIRRTRLKHAIQKVDEARAALTQAIEEYNRI